MIIDSKNIELFKNISLFNLAGLHYDFHNEFKCISMLFEKGAFTLKFRKVDENYCVNLKFTEASIEKFEFNGVIIDSLKGLTIDNLQRGRFEVNDKLVDFNDEGKSYFYLEFYEDIQMEFWCKSVEVEKINV